MHNTAYVMRIMDWSSDVCSTYLFGGRMKAMFSGGAPLNPEIGIFFQSLGLTFLQGYGQTEAAPVISCNRPSAGLRSEEHTSELQSLMRISYAVFCLKKKK